MIRSLPLFAVLLALASPAAAQIGDVGIEGAETVYDGDWIAVGVAGAYMPSYDGSDDYVLTPSPVIQGELGGIGINMRQGGIALDFIPNPAEGIGFSLGPVARLRADRQSQIEDPVVAGLGKLDLAIELGGTAGITIPKLLHGYDSLSFGVDVAWDVAGAHNGMTARPSLTYFTPLSRGAALSLTLDAEYGDERFMDYYYSVTPAQSLASGLGTFDADGGFTRAGATLLGGIDLNGDLTDGGLALIVAGGYSRMLGDARASPFTSERGSANQWLGALGLGFVF